MSKMCGGGCAREKTRAGRSRFPWWFWTLLALGWAAMLRHLILRRAGRRPSVPEPAAEGPAVIELSEIWRQAEPEAAGRGAAAPAIVVVEPAPLPEPAPDDLEIIEGIGPRIAMLLRAADISTFDQLASADVDHLRHILRAARLAMADPATWPDQARLAAARDWEGLEALQRALRAGRRG